MAELVLLWFTVLAATLAAAIVISEHFNRQATPDERRLDTLRWVAKQIDEEREQGDWGTHDGPDDDV